MKVLVQCGKCTAKLNVVIDNPDILNPVFTCPNCGTVNKVQIKKEAPATVPKLNVGWLQFVDNEKKVIKYELQLGVNNIGRKSDKSIAGIQIETDDKFLSRNHFSIEVAKNKRNGYDYLLRDNHSANGTFLNGSADKLSENDELFLQQDDRIRAGQTELILKLPVVSKPTDSSKTTISRDNSKTYIV